MGDGRTDDQACARRAVTSIDGMTADYCPFDHAFFDPVANCIINEVRGQPGDVRHLEQAAGDDRVGVAGTIGRNTVISLWLALPRLSSQHSAHDSSR
jgi:hypothetical protein